MGVPTPPIGLPVPPSDVRVRFADAAVTVGDDVIARLGDACAAVDTSLETLIDTGRDWWPLGVRWALEGEVPAVASVVARPGSAPEVAAILAVCAGAGLPVTVMGGRSGVCGNSVPVFGGVLVDLTGLSGVVAVDDESLLVDVRAGTFGDALEASLREEHRLSLGHWPQSIALSTVGGWLACRGAGQYSTRYGKIEDMVVGLEVALADGRLVRTGGGAPRAATGPDLTQLFVGAEGTLGVITEARLRAHPVPAAERRAAFGFGSFADGLAACRRVLRRGATPAVLRLYDRAESARSFSAPDTNALIVVDEGEPCLIDAVMAIVDEECRHSDRLADDLVERWLERRNHVSDLEMATRAGLTADTIEIAARWSALPGIYRDVIDALTAVEGMLIASAHQSHAYADGGCLYFTFAGRPAAVEAAAADAYYRQAWDTVMSITMSHGGTISHHHGIGLNRARHLAQAMGPAFDVLVSVRAALDPRGVLNPGKLGLPSPFGEAPWP